MFIREIISLVSRHAKYQPFKINPVAVTHSTASHASVILTEQKEGVAAGALRRFDRQKAAFV